MYNSNEFVRRTFYSLELKHQICKEHIENGLSLCDCVEKYNLISHSLVHDWVGTLGYIFRQPCFVFHETQQKSNLKPMVINHPLISHNTVPMKPVI